ncbi:hypothetical protein WR25_10558 isoform B [Diploscapter pachys]|nr:hypothetical protein WR25_10558 isoform B [Diploscapter pachys]
MQPYAYLTVAALLSSQALGMYWMVLKDRIRDGYTPTNAPSRVETDIIREFWNSSGDPMITMMLLKARDKGSMHRPEYLDESQRVIDFLYNNFTVEHKGVTLRFSEMCAPYCNMNKVLQLFKMGYDNELKRVTNGQSPSTTNNLSYPVASIGGISINLDRSFFGVRLQNKSLNATKDKGLPIEKRITNMEHVELVLTLFRGDRENQLRDEQLSKWELAAYEWSIKTYKGNLVELQLVGTEILDSEMMKDGKRMTPFFAAGFGFMITFVSVCVFLSAIYYDALDRGKILVGIGAVTCPILAIVSTYGLISMLGLRINSFMLVMPFLVMGIGVDSCFLMIHSWQRMSRNGYSVVERMGMVYEEVCPSITITSLTDFLSFAIGALAPTPETRLFCLATSIAMAFTFILQLVFFGPILALATRFEHNDTKPRQAIGWRDKVDRVWQKILRIYCRLIGHRIFTICIVSATCVYWYFGIIGLMNMKTRLDVAKILPKNSPLQQPNYILTHIVWSEYHPVTVLINNPFDVTNRTQTNRFWELVDEFQSMPNAKGPESSLIWLKDYIHFSYYGEPYDNALKSVLSDWDFLLGDNEPNKPIDPFKANLTTTKLGQFLRSPFYEHWGPFMKVSNSSEGRLKIDRFWMTIAYQNTSSWETRIGLMEQWRSIVARYKDLNATVWEPNGMFIDQMLSLRSTAVQTGILTLLCMIVVCSIFIPNPCSVITASIAIASISLGVMGFLSWWHFDLDPVVMAAVLMSIGLSVDFIAHVSYHYQLTNKKVIVDGRVVKVPVKGPQEKLEHTMASVGWPMIQAGVSTICCILPLLFLASYSPSVFVAAIFLVVSWGMLHGLVILPSFLGSLPDCLTDANCYRLFLSTSSEKSCRYAGRRDTDEELETFDVMHQKVQNPHDGDSKRHLNTTQEF